MFSLFRLAWRSLIFYRTQHLVLGCAVALCVAVVVGALVVGDCIRGSLRAISLSRLGDVESAVISEHFFRREIAGAEAQPAIILRGAAEFSHTNHGQADGKRLAAGVTLYGVQDAFFSAWGSRNAPHHAETLSAREVILNSTLAERLGAGEGDSLLLRVPTVTDIPVESILGEKEDAVLTLRVTVKRIIPAAGAGAFSLRPNQQQPLLAYVSLEWLGRMLKRDGRANLLLSRLPAWEMDARLRPRLTDVGVRYEICGGDLMEETSGETSGEKDFGAGKPVRHETYRNFTSQQMLIPRSLESALRNTPGGRDAGLRMMSVLVTLANEIRLLGEKEKTVPYSILASTELYGLSELAADEIALNAWCAEDLGANVGDRLCVTYFSPEGHGGVLREASAEFRVAKIVPMRFPWVDENWTPKITGITDQLKMGEWSAPFPFHPQKIRPEDDAYWEAYHATPKGFVSLESGRKLWGSRFGEATSVRVYASAAGAAGTSAEASPDTDETRWTPTAEELGLAFTPVRENLLKASAGATPFDGLFLALSFFVILAAVMLIALLFGLLVDSRRQQAGLLFALGWDEKRVRSLFLWEGMLVAGGGTVLGLLAGLAYAWVVLWALKTVWIGAVNTQHLYFFCSAQSLLAGAACGGGITVAVMAWSVRSLRFLSPRQLTSGDVSISGKATAVTKPVAARWFRCGLSRLAGILLLLAAGCWMGYVVCQNFRRPVQDDMVLAGIFFGCGTLVLAAQLFLLASSWRGAGRGTRRNAGTAHGKNAPRLSVKFQLQTLAHRNVRRRATRSLLIVGLLASTTFLILAIGAFRMDPAGTGAGMDAFQGGTAFFVKTDIPVTFSPAVPEDRGTLGFTSEAEKMLADQAIFAFRLRDGDDATCSNLYRPQEPPILGLPAEFCEKSAFSWANRGAAANAVSPWRLLERELPSDRDGLPQLPVILDQNTAMYMLHFYRGVGDSLVMTNKNGEKIRLVVVAVLGNSVFQGYFLASEPLLLKHFPEVEGFRMVAVLKTPEKLSAEWQKMARVFESALGDFGAHAESADALTSRLLGVQNTYLSAFQALTALGLILGTLGLVAVQTRNMLERRGEFALMRAVGFSRRKLLWLCLCENLEMMFWGFAVGLLAAVWVTLLPMLQGKASFPVSVLVCFAGVSVLIVLGTGGLVAWHRFRKPFLRDLSRE